MPCELGYAPSHFWMHIIDKDSNIATSCRYYLSPSKIKIVLKIVVEVEWNRESYCELQRHCNTIITDMTIIHSYEEHIQEISIYHK